MAVRASGSYEMHTEADLKKDSKKVNTVRGFYRDIAEIEHALQAKVVGLHSKIKFRFPNVDEKGETVDKWYETTPGRALLGQVLPRSAKVPFDVVNKLMTKREISGMIDQVYRHCGQKETVIFCDRIMALGFHHAFKAGISFGKDDMVVPQKKWPIVDRTRELAKEFEQQYNDGLITQGEKYNKVVDAWSKSTDEIADEMMKEISSVKKDKDGRDAQVNSIYMMAHSGARGSPAQMRQLAGMRGLMAKPSGEIIETPIISNFKEGLSVLEYFNSTHGARKGLADTALKTANSGYLTRRLVDVAQDCIITQRGLRHQGRHRGPRHHRRRHRGRVAGDPHSRPHHGRGRQGSVDRQGRHEAQHAAWRAGGRGDRQGQRAGAEDPLRAHLRADQRRVRRLLRARSRPRHAGQHGRGGRRDRGAVDRRAGHPAHHAHVPHRRRGSDLRAVVHRVELRRQDRDQDQGQERRRQEHRRRLDCHGPQHRDRRRRSRRHRAGRPPHPERRAVARRGRPGHQARPAHRRVGSLHPADPHGSRRHRRLRGPGRGSVDVGIGRRGDRYRQARGHRLAHLEPRGRPQARDGHQGQGRQGPEARAWRRCPLPAGGRRHSVGRSRRQGEGRAT